MRKPEWKTRKRTRVWGGCYSFGRRILKSYFLREGKGSLKGGRAGGTSCLLEREAKSDRENERRSRGFRSRKKEKLGKGFLISSSAGGGSKVG